MTIAGAAPWPVLITLLTLPLALRIVRFEARQTSPRALNLVLAQTAGLHMMFGTLLALGFALAVWTGLGLAALGTSRDCAGGCGTCSSSSPRSRLVLSRASAPASCRTNSTSSAQTALFFVATFQNGQVCFSIEVVVARPRASATLPRSCMICAAISSRSLGGLPFEARQVRRGEARRDVLHQLLQRLRAEQLRAPPRSARSPARRTSSDRARRRRTSGDTPAPGGRRARAPRAPRRGRRVRGR